LVRRAAEPSRTLCQVPCPGSVRFVQWPATCRCRSTSAPGPYPEAGELAHSLATPSTSHCAPVSECPFRTGCGSSDRRRLRLLSLYRRVPSLTSYPLCDEGRVSIRPAALAVRSSLQYGQLSPQGCSEASHTKDRRGDWDPRRMLASSRAVVPAARITQHKGKYTAENPQNPQGNPQIPGSSEGEVGRRGSGMRRFASLRKSFAEALPADSPLSPAGCSSDLFRCSPVGQCPHQPSPASHTEPSFPPHRTALGTRGL
jgi:hypothetical protein